MLNTESGVLVLYGCYILSLLWYMSVHILRLSVMLVLKYLVLELSTICFQLSEAVFAGQFGQH